MDNYTDFDGFQGFQKNFVKMAWDEYNSPEQNWPELVLRYWNVIDQKLGGKINHLFIRNKKLRNHLQRTFR
jgi:hypothetical protein